MMNKNYYSFDVFDTVISRITATPLGIFSLIQYKLNHGKYTIKFKSEFKKNFIEIRVSAEQTVRNNSEKEEITLDEIYQYIGLTHQLSDDEIKKLIGIEINEELQSIFGIPSIIKRINNLRNPSNKIIFLSDSYLPYDVIHQMLQNVGAIKEDDVLFVSSEQRKTKESGNLFHYILNKYNCPPHNFYHLGDNKKSDYEVPKKIGINCTLLKESYLTSYEQFILNSDKYGRNNLQLQLLSGFCRKIRLTNVDYINKDEITLYNIGAKIAGPILLGYVIWILNEAKKQNVNTIYFIARDGQILLQIAQKLQKKIAPDIELRYLYGSRQAWHLPAMNTIGEREFDWILEKDPFLTIEIIARRLGLSSDVIIEQLKKISDKPWKSDIKLTHSDIQQLKKVICGTDLLKRIQDNAKQYRRPLVEYLKQERLWENKSWILVDLGWRGRLQDSLETIFHMSQNNKPVVGLYFGLTQFLPKSNSNKNAYFFYPGCDAQHENVGKEFANFLEIFTAGDHGGTLSYYFDSTTYSWKPILIEQNNTEVIRWGLYPLRDGIKKYIEESAEYLDCFDINEKNNFFIELIFNIMRNTLNIPDLQEAQILGKFPFSSDQAGSHIRQFAPPINLKKFLSLTFSNTVNPVEITYWKKGSLIQSNMLVQLLELSCVNFYKFKRRFILKIKKWGSE
jgi:predicted HAD superfamily hydrolase